MCTLTFIPLQEGGVVFTSSRDEAADRMAENLTESADGRLVFPKEPKAGGTWICVEKATGRMVCLLNGAFKKHKRKVGYRRSRGLLVLDFFEYPQATVFFEQYDLEDIEPFTLIVWQEGNLYDFRWDGQQKHLQCLDSSQYHIWSSATLYDAPAQQMRRNWLDEWLSGNPDHYSRAAMLAFHRTPNTQYPQYGLLMSRYKGLLRTIAITSIYYPATGETVHIDYYNLIHGNTSTEQIHYIASPTPKA